MSASLSVCPGALLALKAKKNGIRSRYLKLPPEKCEAFWQRPDLEQAELPEIMTAQTAAELVGHNPQHIHE